MNKYFKWAASRYVAWVLYGILAALFFHYAYTIGSDIFNPHFSEFREGHTFSSTHLFVKGIRPFTIETYPEYYNSYGVLFNLVATPFAILFGNTLILHRILNQLFFVGALAFLALYRTPWRFNFPRYIIMVAAWGMLNFVTNDSVRPDGLGVLLYALSIFIPLRRDFDIPGMLAAMLCAILAFYTKVYFIGGWYLLSVALLFCSWKKFFVYNVCFHALLVLSAVAVVRVFPLYFYETVFAYNTSVCNVGGSMADSLLHSVLQYCRFTLGVLPLLLFILIPFRKTLFRENYLLLAMLVPCALVLFYPLGTNSGANVTYHTHLMLPLLTPLALSAVKKEHGNNIFLFCALFCIMLHLGSLRLSKMPLNFEDPAKWEKIEKYVNDSSRVLNSDCLSYLLMKQDKQLVTDGVSGFVFGYKPSPVTQYLFGEDAQILKKKEQYISRIRSGINEKKFDLIILSNIDTILSRTPDVDMRGYRLVEKIDIKQRGIPPIQFSIYKPTE